MRPSAVFTLFLSLFSTAAVAQWEPFKVHSNSHYKCVEEYFISTPAMDFQVFEKDALIRFVVTDSTLDGDSTMYDSPKVFLSDIDVAYQTVHCPDTASWTGMLIHHDGSWTSSTHFQHDIHWPSGAMETDTFMMISADSVLIIVPEALDTAHVFGTVDSIASYHVDLYVNGVHQAGDSLSNMPVTLSKSFGLLEFPMPLALPRLNVPMKLRTQDTLGFNHGLTDYGFYHYNIGTELHYLSTSESGYHNGWWNEISSITTTLDRWIVTEVFLGSGGNVAYELSLLQSVRRDSFAQNMANQSNELLGSSYSHASGTVLWNEMDLYQFHEEAVPNQPRQLEGMRHHILRDHDSYAELRFIRWPMWPSDTCPTQYVMGESYGIHDNVVLDTRYGLFYESSSGIYDYQSPYFTWEKKLMYFRKGTSMYGEPVPPLSVEDVAEQPSFQIYPNPATDVISINAEGIVEDLYIRDMSGRVVYHLSQLGNGSNTVSLEELGSGIYQISLRVNNAEVHTRLVKH